MILYTYCTYKLSDFGYQIGKFKCDKDKDDIKPCNDFDETDRFIASLFEDDQIDYLCCGKIPDKKGYFIMLKNIKSEGENGIWKQMNFAFLFDYSEYDLFQKMIVYLEIPKEKKDNRKNQCEKLEKLIIPAPGKVSDNTKTIETGIVVSESEWKKLESRVNDKLPDEDEFFKDSFYIFRLNEPESMQETPPFRFKKLLPDDFVVKRKNSGIYVVKKNLLTEMLTEKNLMMALEILKILLLILILIIK